MKLGVVTRNAWWRRVRIAARSQATLGGVLFSLSLGVVSAAAIVSGNNLLFLIMAAMVALLLISGFVSRLCLAGLEVDFKTPDHITARRTVHATLGIRNLKTWMPSFSVRVEGARAADGGAPPILRSSVYLPLIAAGATASEPVEIHFARRGQYRQNGFSISTRFPFGFREKSAEVNLTRDVLVYPSIEPRSGFEEILASITGDLEGPHKGSGHDFYRIRPYQPGESARHLDWKSSAHTGSLQVREFTREQERTVEIFLDRNLGTWGPREETWFEAAVDCCAFLCWRLTLRGLRLNFRSQGFVRRVPEEADNYTILRYLALVSPLAEGPLEAPFEENSEQVVFTLSESQAVPLGWNPEHIIGLAALPLEPAGADDAAHRTRPHGDHRGGEGDE
jgi:uncharacterized protein (DUF58 family)